MAAIDLHSRNEIASNRKFMGNFFDLVEMTSYGMMWFRKSLLVDLVRADSKKKLLDVRDAAALGSALLALPIC